MSFCSLPLATSMVTNPGSTVGCGKMSLRRVAAGRKAVAVCRLLARYPRTASLRGRRAQARWRSYTAQARHSACGRMVWAGAPHCRSNAVRVQPAHDAQLFRFISGEQRRRGDTCSHRIRPHRCSAGFLLAGSQMPRRNGNRRLIQLRVRPMAPRTPAAGVRASRASCCMLCWNRQPQAPVATTRIGAASPMRFCGSMGSLLQMLPSPVPPSLRVSTTRSDMKRAAGCSR